MFLRWYQNRVVFRHETDDPLPKPVVNLDKDEWLTRLDKAYCVDDIQGLHNNAFISTVRQASSMGCEWAHSLSRKLRGWCKSHGLEYGE